MKTLLLIATTIAISSGSLSAQQLTGPHARQHIVALAPIRAMGGSPEVPGAAHTGGSDVE
jgi:hypothetical protein